MEQLIRDFLEYIQGSKGYAHNTVEAYRNDLTQFLAYVTNSSPPVATWGLVDASLLHAYQDHLIERSYTPASVARKVAVIKTFFHFLVERHVVPADPTMGLESPKVEKRLPQILSPEEVERLLTAPAQHSTPKGFRDRAILELLYASGLRVSELVSLDADDVSVAAKTVRCAGRGDKHRTIPISDRASEALANYVNRGRPAFSTDSGQAALFVNPRGDRLTRQGLWLIIKEYVKESEISVQVTPHTLRHSYAAHMLERGENLQSVQQLLGHSNITTTQVYARLAEASHSEPGDGALPVTQD